MKIEFISQDDPLYILPFFEEFFRNYSKDFEIAQVSISRAMGKRPRTQLLKELACLYRPTGFARILGRVGFSKMMGALPRSRASSRFYTLAQLCRAYGVPCQPIGNPNAPEFIETVKQRSADVIVSVACPFILKETFLNLPPLGCINIHHAPLPRYKGMMPTFWQMFHGEKKVGVTVHYMVPKLDEGQALLQAELEIQPGESLDQLIQRSKRHGAHCMAKVLKQVAAGTQQVLRMEPSEGSYFTFPTLEQIREFQRRGYRTI